MLLILACKWMLHFCNFCRHNIVETTEEEQLEHAGKTFFVGVFVKRSELCE